MRLKHSLALILAFAFISINSAIAAGVKYKTSGTFVDSGGGQHAWNINDAHTLIWDGDAYIPVGASFTPKYVTQGDTEENYEADVKALEAIKSKGITDILLKGAGPITSGDPLAWRRIVNYLDTNGFTYGIELDDGPKDSLRGYLVSPNRYRIEGPSNETTIPCDWPNVDSAIFLVIDKYDNTVVARGGAVRKDGRLAVNLTAPLGSSHILLIYTHRSFMPISQGGIGDLWSGFGEYRDRVLAFLKSVKFGPGMRFFLEPFTSKMDFTGDMANFVPDSAGFRVGLEAYLVKKYIHEGGLNSAWGMTDLLEGMEVAARVLPMWGSGRGAPYIYDKASAKLYSVDATGSQFWRDIVDYRDISAQEYMNTISDTLRKQVANVPVIFKCSKYHRIFANPFGMGGFDGIGAEGYGLGDAPVVNAGGPAYSLAEESAKSTWLITASTQAAALPNSAGYPDETSMFAALDSLREVGCKGFFVDGLPLGDGQIDWLKNFKSRLNSSALVDFRPTVINYPVGVQTGAHVKRLMPNTWWLPTLRNGRTKDIGDGLGVYAISGEDRSYVWSNSGDRTITLKAGPMGTPSIEFPSQGGALDKKRGTFPVGLTETPTMIRGMDFTLLFPCETAQAEIDKLTAAIIEADKQGSDVQRARVAVENAINVLANGQPLIAFGIAEASLKDLAVTLGADTWIEGEHSPANSFDGVQPMAGASRGCALVLDSDDNPPLTPYSAAYSFDVSANSSYEIWIAATPPADGSPMTYGLDDVSWSPVASDGETDDYAPGLAWYKIGTANLMPGRHILKVKAEGRRQQDNRYYFAIDAVVLSPKGFKPGG